MWEDLGRTQVSHKFQECGLLKSAQKWQKILFSFGGGVRHVFVDTLIKDAFLHETLPKSCRLCL